MKDYSKCPYCGEKEFVEARETGVGITCTNRKFINGRMQMLYHTVCKNCGTVVRSYVKKPKELSDW